MANEELREQHMEKALQCATDCFLRHGVYLTTKEVIARESGLSRATVNRYWQTKADVVVDTLKYILEQVYGKIRNVYDENVHLSGAEQLNKFFQTLEDIFVQDARIFVLFLEFKHFVFRDESLDKAKLEAAKQTLENRGSLVKILENGLKDGSLHIKEPGTPQTTADYLVSNAMGMLSELAMEESIPMETKIKHIRVYKEALLKVGQNEGFI